MHPAQGLKSKRVLGGDHYQISVSIGVQHVKLMMKVTLEAKPEVIKMHHGS